MLKKSRMHIPHSGNPETDNYSLTSKPKSCTGTGLSNSSSSFKVVVRRGTDSYFHKNPSSAVWLSRPSNPPVGLWDAISTTGCSVSNYRVCAPGASASCSGARGFLAFISTMADESSMGCGPSFKLCLRETRKTSDDAGLPAGSMSKSNWEPLLWVSLRFRSRSSFSRMYDAMGPEVGSAGQRWLRRYWC